MTTCTLLASSSGLLIPLVSILIGLGLGRLFWRPENLRALELERKLHRAQDEARRLKHRVAEEQARRSGQG